MSSNGNELVDRDAWLNAVFTDETISDTDVAVCVQIYFLLGRLDGSVGILLDE